MKYLFLILLLVGCKSSPKNVYEKCEQIGNKEGINGYSSVHHENKDIYCQVLIEKHKPFTGIPKFKPGDCIRRYGSFENKIQSIFGENYGVLIGTSCKDVKNWNECGNSRSAYDIEITDANSIKIECPK